MRRQEMLWWRTEPWNILINKGSLMYFFLFFFLLSADSHSLSLPVFTVMLLWSALCDCIRYEQRSKPAVTDINEDEKGLVSTHKRLPVHTEWKQTDHTCSWPTKASNCWHFSESLCVSAFYLCWCVHIVFVLFVLVSCGGALEGVWAGRCQELQVTTELSACVCVRVCGVDSSLAVWSQWNHNES